MADPYPADILVETMTDEELIRAYERSGGEAGDPVADALAAELWRRNLDV